MAAAPLGSAMADDDERRSFPITLPPIRLPPLFPEGRPPFFPERLSVVLPAPERVRGSGNPLLAAVALDVVDAVVVLALGGGLARVVLGTLLAGALAGPIGIAYALEALPGTVGPPWLAVLPSATLLVLARVLLDREGSGSGRKG